MIDFEAAFLPAGTPPTYSFKGPWFSTQLALSLTLGISSFLLFCFLRTRWEVVYMGRTKLKDFSPSPAHSDATQSSPSSRFFGWVLPTLRTSEFTVLQTVGLDAAVLLNFFRMSFYLFSISAVAAAVVLMPVNWTRNGSVDADPDLPDNSTHGGNSTSIIFLSHHHNGTSPPTFYDLIIDPQTSATLHLVFTYVFTLLCLSFFHRNFHRFVQARQAFSLHLIHSVSARTVLVTNVPPHLRGDKALADYFESMSWTVESVSVCRDVGKLKKLLDARTNALLSLEAAWTKYVGNPAKQTTGYTPDVYSGARLTASPQQVGTLIPDLDEPESNGTAVSNDAEASETSQAVSTNPRPRFRPRWFGASVDAIDYWEKRFRAADESVRSMRKTGQFGATHAAFVTFEDVKDAQSACQVLHFPHHSQVVTKLAPEPRDVLWSNIDLSQRSSKIRHFVVLLLVAFVLLFWIAPVTFLASFLSYEEIKRVAPWLARIINSNPRIGALVQNTLPSTALILFNGLLPFLLDWLSMEQGLVSRSAVEYALMRKYTLALMLNVLGVFLVASSYWALAKDLAESPMKIPEKLAEVLQGANARNFFLSYVMLQGIGIMPFQLLNIGSVLFMAFYRLFYTRTPRDFAEIYAPPSLNYGTVYPQAILVFTICLCYSVVSPLILVFGSIYFGVGYLVYKYKLLFVYYKPYESSGSAWRITFSRLLWGVFIFQLFMTGLFTLRGHWVLSIALIPLILYTAYWSYTLYGDFRPLCKYTALSNVCEVERGEAAEQVVGVRGEETVTRSQSNLNRQRYAVNDETLYVAPSDARTNYSQPPMSSFYPGVLNTGRRKYAHPALSGRLPTPWLPARAQHPEVTSKGPKSVVLSLRRKVGKKLSKNRPVPEDDDWETPPASRGSRENLAVSQPSTSSNPWDERSPSPAEQPALKQRMSFDPASGVMAMPDDNVWASADTSDEEALASSQTSTYYPHPERQRSASSSRDAGWTS